MYDYIEALRKKFYTCEFARQPPYSFEKDEEATAEAIYMAETKRTGGAKIAPQDNE